MKFVIACLMALTLAACSSDSDKKGGGPGGLTGPGDANNGQNGNQPGDIGSIGNSKPAAPPPSCNLFPARTSIEGTWFTTQYDNGFQLTTTLTVRSNQVQLSNTCMYNNASVTATVVAPARYGNGVLEILSRAEKTERLQLDGGALDCTVSVEPAQMNYAMNGSCLEFSIPGQGNIIFSPR